MPSDPGVLLSVHGIGKEFRAYRGAFDRLRDLLSRGSPRHGRGHTALEDVSFDLREGETLGILGRNGAGKTTLLGILSGAIAPTGGTMVRPGRLGVLINLGAGFDPESTGRINARQWGHLAEGGAYTAEEEDWIGHFTELGDAFDRPVKTYSAGMQLRLGFATATVRRPDLLIIDEVMAVGDFFFRRKCHERIRSFVEQGTAAILVSHDHTEILHFCRRALVLDGGRIDFLGPAATAVNRYLLSQGPKRASGTVDETLLTADAGLIALPEGHQLLDTSSMDRSSLRGISLRALACCNTELSRCHVFEQGQQAVIIVEILAEEDLDVPVIGVQITDEHGLLIHGTSTYLHDGQACRVMKRGESVRTRFEIGLGLRYGEYQVDIAFGDVGPSEFSGRADLSFNEFGAAVRQLGRVPGAFLIAVVPRQGGKPTQLTHHGMCHLPGTASVHFPMQKMAHEA